MEWTQSLNGINMHDILLWCSFDKQNFIRKSVTILKLLIRAINCRLAKTHSSIHLDSTSKTVGELFFRICKKSVQAVYSKMAGYSLPKQALTNLSDFQTQNRSF